MVVPCGGKLGLPTFWRGLLDFLELLQGISKAVWGPPLLIMLLGTGLFLSIRLKGLQFQKLSQSFYLAIVKRKESGAAGDISHFQALMTALAATVGTGNIAGVATAIAAGGPGALFWMWITGLLGMATKFSEALLAVKFRVINDRGEMAGGPMYYLELGLKKKLLATLFAVLTVLASFGIGNMVQSNSVAQVLQSSFEIPFLWTGLFMTWATAAVTLGGIHSIAKVVSAIVPTMIILYMLVGLVILIVHWREIPVVFIQIFEGAFAPMAAIGGFAGTHLMKTIRLGVSRGIFSNESGMGSAAIAAAAAKTRNPVTQALVSMTQTFIDTLVVCSVTGFVVLVSGLWTEGATGAALTSISFNFGLGWWGGFIVSLSLIFFAYSTILGWHYYGEKALFYLVGNSRYALLYRLAWAGGTFLGAILSLDIVWTISDIMNGLMAFPNLIALTFLSGLVVSEVRSYFNKKNH